MQSADEFAQPSVKLIESAVFTELPKPPEVLFSEDRAKMLMNCPPLLSKHENPNQFKEQCDKFGYWYKPQKVVMKQFFFRDWKAGFEDVEEVVGWVLTKK